MFSIYVSDFINTFSNPHVKLKLYADDLTVYVTYSKDQAASAQSHLNSFITHLSSWSIQNSLPISVNKCKLLHLGLGNPQYIYSIFNEPIVPTSESVRLLGLIVDPQLKFNLHITNKCNKALKTWHFLVRSLKSNSAQILKKVYTTYVLPILDFASIIFHRHLTTLSLMEIVQKRITRHIYIRCHIKPIPRYPERLKFLKLDTISSRHTDLDLRTFQKILSIQLLIDPVHFPVLLNASPIRYKVPLAKLNCRYHSLFVRVPRLLNAKRIKPTQSAPTI